MRPSFQAQFGGLLGSKFPGRGEPEPPSSTVGPVLFTFLAGHSQRLDRQGVLDPGHPGLETLLLIFALLLLCLLLLLLGLSENPPYVCMAKTVGPDRQED